MDEYVIEIRKRISFNPLLKIIAFSLKEYKKYDNLKNALKEAAIFTLDVSRDLISSVFTTHVSSLFLKIFFSSI